MQATTCADQHPAPAAAHGLLREASTPRQTLQQQWPAPAVAGPRRAKALWQAALGCNRALQEACALTGHCSCAAPMPRGPRGGILSWPWSTCSKPRRPTPPLPPRTARLNRPAANPNPRTGCGCGWAGLDPEPRQTALEDGCWREASLARARRKPWGLEGPGWPRALLRTLVAQLRLELGARTRRSCFQAPRRAARSAALGSSGARQAAARADRQ